MHARRIEDNCFDLDKNLLLWINVSLGEFSIDHSRLCSLFDDQKRFDDQYQCEEYISHHISIDDRIVLIINETKISDDLLTRLIHTRQVSAIYIQCSCQNRHEDWNQPSLKQFNKV